MYPDAQNLTIYRNTTVPPVRHFYLSLQKLISQDSYSPMPLPVVPTSHSLLHSHPCHKEATTLHRDSSSICSETPHESVSLLLPLATGGQTLPSLPGPVQLWQESPHPSPWSFTSGFPGLVSFSFMSHALKLFPDLFFTWFSGLHSPPACFLWWVISSNLKSSQFPPQRELLQRP